MDLKSRMAIRFKKKEKLRKKCLAGLLCIVLLFQMVGVTTSVFATNDLGGVVCDAHQQHDESCGYVAGSPAQEASEGAPCGHEHSSECKQMVTQCVHQHDEQCFATNEDDGGVTLDLKPTACVHECSEESGCITAQWVCVHNESGVHDDTCGYTPATEAAEAVEGSPCTHSCALCETPKLMLPIFGKDTTKDVTALLGQEIELWQDGQLIGEKTEEDEGDKLDVTKSFTITFPKCTVPVAGDNPESADTANIVASGDYAIFELPEDFKLTTTKTVDLISDGEKVAEASFATDTITVTFADIVDNTNVSGVWITFSAEMQYSGDVGSGETGDKVITILGKDYTITFPKTVTVISGEKTGVADVGNKVINWTVKVTAKDTVVGKPDTDGDLCGYIFSDDLTVVGEYVGESFKIGTTNDVSIATVDNSVKYIDGNLSYGFATKDTIGTRYLFFQTNIPEKNLTADGEQTIENTALIKKDKETKATLPAEVTFTMKWIEKNGKVVDGSAGDVYDPASQKIAWTIEANLMSATLNNAVITDKLPEGLAFESATVAYWEAASGGPGQWGAANPITPTDDGSDLKCKYALQSPLSVPVQLIITAVVTQSDIGANIKRFTNEASISWEGNDGGFGATSKPVGVGVASITKKAGAYDASTHQIPWTVTVDPKQQILGGNLRVLDLLIYDKKGFDKTATYEISNNESKNQFDVTLEDIKQLTLRYNQKFVAGSFETTDGLGYKVHTLSLAGKPVADLLVVAKSDGSGLDYMKSNRFTFSTLVTNPDMYATNSPKPAKIDNTASLFSSNKKLSDAYANQSITSKMLQKDMLTRDNAAAFDNSDGSQVDDINAKVADAAQGFRYDDKSATFRIIVNGNNLTDATNDVTGVHGEALGALTVTDTLPKGWEFEPIHGKDFLLYEVAPGTLKATGSPVDIATIPVQVQTQDATETQGQSMSFTFEKLTKPYVIVVKGAPTAETAAGYFDHNGQTTVTNTATLENSHFTANPSVSQKVSINSTLLDKQIDKTMADKEGFLTWTVKYQPYEISHDSVYLEDKLPLGLDVRINSLGELQIAGNITANEMTLQPDGSYAIGEMVDLTAGKLVSYDTTTRILRFDIPDKAKAYQLTYITDITGTTGKLTNQVSLYGAAGSTTGKDVGYEISALAAEAGFKRSGWLLINKTKEDAQSLAGAEFTLFSEDGSTIIRQGLSGADGKLYLKAIPEGKYVLKETKAPAGYVGTGETYTVSVGKDVLGKFVTVINQQSGNDANTITIKNLPKGTTGDLAITKKVAGTRPEADKEFSFTVQLTKDGAPVTGKYVVVNEGISADLIFDAQGKAGITLKGGQIITLKNLPKDTQYAITEADYTMDAYWQTAQSGDTGTIIVGDIQEETNPIHQATFTNTRKVGDLTIRKEVAGNAADATKAFDFTVTFTGVGADKEYAFTGIGIADGIIKNGGKIALAHQQSITIHNLPAGLNYKVTEADYSAGGYQTNSSGGQDTIVHGFIKTTVFVNTKRSSGGGGGVIPPVEPDKPIEPEKPKEPELPKEPEAPIVPTEPVAPETPGIVVPPTTPEGPTYRPDNVPDPNDPASPEYIVIIDDDGVPRGYHKQQNDDGLFEYIDDEGVPMGFVPRMSAVPKTGDDTPVGAMILIMIIALSTACGLTIWKKKRFQD